MGASHAEADRPLQCGMGQSSSRAVMDKAKKNGLEGQDGQLLATDRIARGAQHI